MRILVSNDDGVYSPGIAALAEVASHFGTVQIVAPDSERSSAGHSITSSRPLSYRATRVHGFDAFRVDGTPADCVALGAHIWGHVDLVLSGLNIGLNLGSSTWHSGTLAAAKQATLLGLRGMALSVPASADPDYDPFKPWVHKAIETVLKDPSLRLVNANFPRNPRGTIWTRASIRQYDGQIVPTKDPMGRECYWFTVTPLTEAEEGTDRWALEQGWVSLTPLRLDPTDLARLDHERRENPLDEVRAANTSEPKSSPQAAKEVRKEEAAPPLERQPG